MSAGDFALGQTIDIKFTTRRFSTGVPFTLAGTPSVAAYPDNSTAEVTAGITLTVDFDLRTGLNNVRVVATSGNGYATNTSYALVITAGTVDSVSVVGEVVGHFTIERSAAFGRLGAPAGASVSADVAAVKVDTAAVLVDTTQIKADLPTRITKNVALSAFTFFMVDSVDHVTGKTGLTVTATRSLDGAAFGACANAVTEIANGFYKIDLAAADLNANVVALKLTATGADMRAVTIVTQPT